MATPAEENLRRLNSLPPDKQEYVLRGIYKKDPELARSIVALKNEKGNFLRSPSEVADIAEEALTKAVAVPFNLIPGVVSAIEEVGSLAELGRKQPAGTSVLPTPLDIPFNATVGAVSKYGPKKTAVGMGRIAANVAPVMLGPLGAEFVSPVVDALYTKGTEIAGLAEPTSDKERMTDMMGGMIGGGILGQASKFAPEASKVKSVTNAAAGGLRDVVRNFIPDAINRIKATVKHDPGGSYSTALGGVGREAEMGKLTRLINKADDFESSGFITGDKFNPKTLTVEGKAPKTILDLEKNLQANLGKESPIIAERTKFIDAYDPFLKEIGDGGIGLKGHKLLTGSKGGRVVLQEGIDLSKAEAYVASRKGYSGTRELGGDLEDFLKEQVKDLSSSGSGIGEGYTKTRTLKELQNDVQRMYDMQRDMHEYSIKAQKAETVDPGAIKNHYKQDVLNILIDEYKGAIEGKVKQIYADHPDALAAHPPEKLERLNAIYSAGSEYLPLVQERVFNIRKGFQPRTESSPSVGVSMSPKGNLYGRIGEALGSDKRRILKQGRQFGTDMDALQMTQEARQTGNVRRPPVTMPGSLVAAPGEAAPGFTRSLPAVSVIERSIGSVVDNWEQIMPQLAKGLPPELGPQIVKQIDEAKETGNPKEIRFQVGKALFADANLRKMFGPSMTGYRSEIDGVFADQSEKASFSDAVRIAVKRGDIDLEQASDIGEALRTDEPIKTLPKALKVVAPEPSGSDILSGLMQQ